jgi:rhodanese-related sulfurtransferase
VAEVSHPSIEDVLAEAQAAIPRYTPSQARDAAADGAILVDVRPLEQRRRDGLDPASRWRIPELARRDVPVILICDEGYQTSLAAVVLRRLGVDAGDVIGGVQGWIEAGLPVSAGVVNGEEWTPSARCA